LVGTLHLGDRDIDFEIYQELHDSGLFETMGRTADEVSTTSFVFKNTKNVFLQAEHSLELHTPYIEYIMR